MENKDKERIKVDAEAATNEVNEKLRETSTNFDRRTTYIDGYHTGYIAGATAVHERAQVLADALKLIKRSLSGINDIVTNDVISIAATALNKWEGKEVENGK